MLKELEKSGLPIFQNSDSLKLAIEAPYTVNGFGEKSLAQMTKLFEDSSKSNPQMNIYDVYRQIIKEKDKSLFEKYQFQYDITVVHSGQIGFECKKTSGHYHGWEKNKNHSYPEVYEVISGTALFELQKSKNFDVSDPENIKIDDIILVKVSAGQSIIVPPDYGHCSINIGNGDLIFSNLAYQPCEIFYDNVQYHHGLGVYVGKNDNNLIFHKNPHYQVLPKARLATPLENKQLGIAFGCPVYQEFLSNPNHFDFLGHPDNYITQIMKMFEVEEEI